ncbi:MAG: sensor histidine kinase [Sediminibacterium sp.]|nr:sensor histidine kinase [Sediminibacterium sp.]
MDIAKVTQEYIQRHGVVRHLLFWMVIVLVNATTGLLDGDPLWAIMILNTCLHIPQVLATYFFAYVLIPRFLVKRRYAETVLVFIITSYLFAVIGRILVVHVGEELVRPKPFEQEPIAEILTDLNKLLVLYLPSVYVAAFQFLFVKYFLSYRQSKEKEIMLSKEKAEAELKTLKAQLNPHFLFNTLNNIYSLSLDNSPKTPVAIGKLSEILDHVLYKCNKPFVSLSSEITLLKNQIELEKLRYDERLEVSFKTDIDRDIAIPPLILLSLLENAFKHGAGEDSGSPKIDIDIKQKEQNFQFTISNTVTRQYEKRNRTTIGLANIRQQLDLIYGSDYTLDIQTPSGLFRVILYIRLTNLHEV